MTAIEMDGDSLCFHAFSWQIIGFKKSNVRKKVVMGAQGWFVVVHLSWVLQRQGNLSMAFVFGLFGVTIKL